MAVTKLHPIDTVNVPGRIGETLNLLVGCKGHPCKRWCWAHPLAKRLKCPKCRTFEPHTHWERIPPASRKQAYCYFQDMAEPNDFSFEQIDGLKAVIKSRPNALWQILSHFPELFQKYPDWPQNTWAMITFTEGTVWHPAELQAGKIVAYIEPVTGPLTISTDGGAYAEWDLIVIGLLNHASYAKLGISLEQLAGWIKPLIADADALGIPVFCKRPNDPRWEAMGIIPRQEWPKSPNPPAPLGPEEK